MSYANGTPFLNLPQTVGTDHRDWFDTNEAFLNLDIKMKTLWDGAASTADILEQLQETVSGLDTDVSALQTLVDGHTTTLQTVNESLVLINNALTALNTDVHTKFDSAGIADPYDPTYGIYAVGDIVTYNGQRYKCVTAVTAAEPFDADKWLAEDIQTVIDGLNSDLSNITSDASTDIYLRNSLFGDNQVVHAQRIGDYIIASFNGYTDVGGLTADDFVIAAFSNNLTLEIGNNIGFINTDGSQPHTCSLTVSNENHNIRCSNPTAGRYFSFETVFKIINE